MNIESSHKFTRSGDTASGCIEGVNLEDYQVGVMGATQITPMMSLQGIIIIVSFIPQRNWVGLPMTLYY